MFLVHGLVVKPCLPCASENRNTLGHFGFWPSLIKPSCRLQKDRDGAIPAEFRLRAGGVDSDARDVVYGTSRPGAADAVPSRPESQYKLRSRSVGDTEPELHVAVAAIHADAPEAVVAAVAGSAAGAANAPAADAACSDGMSGLGRSVGGAVCLELWHSAWGRAVLWPCDEGFRRLRGRGLHSALRGIATLPGRGQAAFQDLRVHRSTNPPQARCRAEGQG